MSTHTRYDWERFWVDPRARLQISADDFFEDPRADPTWLRPNVDAVNLSEASSAPCLILLGEPGLGKSQAVKDAVRNLGESPDRPLYLSLDLGVYSDPASIRAKVGDQEPNLSPLPRQCR